MQIAQKINHITHHVKQSGNAMVRKLKALPNTLTVLGCPAHKEAPFCMVNEYLAVLYLLVPKAVIHTINNQPLSHTSPEANHEVVYRDPVIHHRIRIKNGYKQLAKFSAF